MTRIAHLTDLHFGAADPVVVAALICALNDDPPDLLVVSGDLTQGARRSEFREARAFLRACPAPSLCVPGNHDITPYRLDERFLEPYRRWHEEICAETEPSWHDGIVAVQGLNTARRGGLYLDWSRGRVTRSRLASLLARFDALPPGRIRIVVTHHPLLPHEDLPPGRTTGGAERALAAFAAHQVRLVLAGHLHRSYVGALETPLILQGGSATSTRLRGERNAYNRLQFEPSGETKIKGFVWSGSNWELGSTQTIRLAPA